MAEEIVVNFERLTTVSSNMQQQADQVQQLINALNPKIEDLRAGGWIGNGANAFYQEIDNLVMPTLVALKKALEETQDTFTQMATDFNNADDEISRLMGGA